MFLYVCVLAHSIQAIQRQLLFTPARLIRINVLSISSVIRFKPNFIVFYISQVAS